MAATFTWLDISESQRRRMLEIVQLIAEPGTVDELGLGAIRDALSDTLFPGTSTLHRRPRYLLFVPWIYRSLEQEGTTAQQVASRLKRREVRLIEALRAGGEREGVIGIDAGASLKRFPSIVYWNAFAVLGIRLFPGSQAQYHSRFDGYRKRSQVVLRTDDGAPAEEREPSWHPGLPEPPDDYLTRTAFALRRQDAEYLQERILQRVPHSYLAHLVAQEREVDDEVPWAAAALEAAPAQLRGLVEHARCFSELLHGAALLYNLILAEHLDKARRAGSDDFVVDEDHTDHYRALLGGWGARVEERVTDYRHWDQAAFWGLVRRQNPRVSGRAERFARRWVELATARAGDVTDDPRARQLVADREVETKRRMARVANLRALERWSGASGTDQMTFRWTQARQVVTDVVAGLRS